MLGVYAGLAVLRQRVFRCKIEEMHSAIGRTCVQLVLLGKFDHEALFVSTCRFFSR